MAEQDDWQNMEIDKMGEQKELSSAIKEKRKTPEYKEWKQEVKNMNREIKAAANDPEKLVKLAEELKQLQAKDPTLPEQQKLESVKNDRIAISEIIKDNDERLVEIKKDRDDKLSELLESKETALAKVEKQSFWQRVVGALTPKAKKFKTNVVDKIAEKAKSIEFVEKKTENQIQEEIPVDLNDYFNSTTGWDDGTDWNCTGLEDEESQEAFDAVLKKNGIYWSDKKGCYVRKTK